ncbi:hypothetical protein [Streptomyces sp. NPDC046759]|uniref:hypothetical protein n=1 Tax=Streptomyces sp. NPDC046759 TaxID=3155019 RepID=UPI0033DD4D25
MTHTRTGPRGADPVAGWLRHPHAATALPAAVLLAGRSPAGHLLGGLLAVAALGAGVLAARPRPRPAGRGTPAASGTARLAGGVLAAAGLAALPLLPGPVWVACSGLAGLMWLLGYVAAAGPAGTAVPRPVPTWSVAAPLSVLLCLLTRPEVPLAALAALDAAALALLTAVPDAAPRPAAARVTARRQRPGRRRDRRGRSPSREPWPAGQRRWVNQRTP